MRLAGVAVRLRVALLRGSLRAGPGATGRRLGLLGGGAVGLVLAVVGLLVLAGSRGAGRLPEDLAVLLFAGLVAGWTVLPVLTFGSDDLLDPARLALLPLTRRQLLVVLGTGALVGVAPVATAVAALGLLPALGTGPGSYAVGLAAVVLLLLLCVGTSRASAAALSGLLRSRRGRDLGVGLAALLGLGAQLVNPLLQRTARTGGPRESALHALAGPLRWTPPGLLATAPERGPAGAALSLGAGAVCVAAVLLLWGRSVRRAQERADTTGSRRRRHTALAPAGLPLPGGRVGAVAAKDLRYLGREPRRLVAALTSTLLPVLALVLGPLLLGGSGGGGGGPRVGHALPFTACGTALLVGLAGANRFGLDGSATWLLLSSRTDPRDARRDLLGGDLAVAVLAVPVLLATAVGLAALSGGWALLPAALGVALALFAVTVALSGWVAVSAAYPVPPSQNAFSSGGTGQGCAAGLVTLGALLAGAALCLPLLVLLVPALLSGGGAAGLALLLAGPAYGLGVGALVRRAAARRWADRAPEVLLLLSSAR